MANARYKGALPEERLSINTLLDADMIQVRHRIGLDGDSDKGVSRAVLQGMPVAVCSTGEAVASKFATLTNCPDFTLVSGRSVIVYFNNGNTADSPTLNVADTGAIPISSTTGNPYWVGGTWQMFTYVSALVDGVTKTNWILIQGAFDNIIANNVTEYLLDGSLYPRIMGYGYVQCQDLKNGDYFYALGSYDKKDKNNLFKLVIKDDKVFAISCFDFFKYISHNFYRTTFDDMLSYDYRFNPLLCLYPRIFTMQNAIDLGINPMSGTIAKTIKYFADKQLTVIKIDNEYVMSLNNGLTWTKIDGPEGTITNVFYENGNIYFRGATYEVCGTYSNGEYVPMESTQSERVMSKWLDYICGITTENKISEGFDGRQVLLTGYDANSQTTTYFTSFEPRVNTVAYTVNDDGDLFVMARMITGAAGTNIWKITFTRNSEEVECSKILVSSYGNLLYVIAVRQEGSDYYLMVSDAIDVWNSTSVSGEITVELYDVYNYTQKTSSDMLMKVVPSKMSFARMGTTSFFCALNKKGSISRYIISTDSSDSKRIACRCGDVSFNVEDLWDSRFEYDETGMNLYRLYDNFQFYDTEEYIRQYRYKEFTQQSEQIIPMSPPEEHYTESGDDCDCFIQIR